MNTKPFTSFHQALAIVTDESMIDKKIWREALAYCMENAPPHLQPQIDKINRDLFNEWYPELKPKHCDDQGNLYFDAEDLKKTMGLSDADFNEAVDEMVEIQETTGSKLLKPADKLQRIH